MEIHVNISTSQSNKSFKKYIYLTMFKLSSSLHKIGDVTDLPGRNYCVLWGGECL